MTRYPYRGKPGWLGTYPATYKRAVLGLALITCIFSCATFKRANIMIQLPSTTDAFVCDIVPYMHPTHSGRFIFRPDLACTPQVLSWFTSRVIAGVDRLARDGSYPVLYVVDEVLFISINNLHFFDRQA